MLKVLICIYLLSASVELAFSQASLTVADSLFKYETIPFGWTLEQVREALGEASVTDANSSVETVCNFELEDIFQDGLYKASNYGCFLMSDVTRTLKLTGADGEIRLYFVRDFEGDSSYTLMMVSKELPMAKGELASTFDALKNAIAAKLPIAPTVIDKRFGTEVHRLVYDETFPARVAVWATEKTRVILTSWSAYSTCYRQVLYRSEPQWKKYLKSSRLAFIARQKQSEEKAGADGARF